ncbi:MAG TPA: DUF4142 domain-containing protein [Beijerinckiaceae bacterium]|jgi:predicted outer membrane protein
MTAAPTPPDLTLTRRRLLLAGLALGVITPAQATGYGLAVVDPAVDAAQVNALLSTGALARQTSLLALRSPNPDIRHFARSEIAEQRGMARAVTGTPDPAIPLGRRGTAILAEAQSLPPSLPADQLYVARQIEGHQRLLALASTYARAGADPDVAAVARGSIPLIRLHLSVLSTLNGALVG